MRRWNDGECKGNYPMMTLFQLSLAMGYSNSDVPFTIAMSVYYDKIT